MDGDGERERGVQSVEEERWNIWQLPNRNLHINKRNLVFFRWFWLGEKWKRWLTRFVKKMRKINFFLIIENVVYINLITTHKPGHTKIRNIFFEIKYIDVIF